MITMVLGGLWHGAAWTFVVWGVLQGSGSAWPHPPHERERGPPAWPTGPCGSPGSVSLTFQFVCLGWVFFSATVLVTAFTMIGRLFTAGAGSPLVTPLLVVTVFGTVAIQYIPK